MTRTRKQIKDEEACYESETTKFSIYEAAYLLCGIEINKPGDITDEIQEKVDNMTGQLKSAIIKHRLWSNYEVITTNIMEVWLAEHPELLYDNMYPTVSKDIHEESQRPYRWFQAFDSWEEKFVVQDAFWKKIRIGKKQLDRYAIYIGIIIEFPNEAPYDPQRYIEAIRMEEKLQSKIAELEETNKALLKDVTNFIITGKYKNNEIKKIENLFQFEEDYRVITFQRQFHFTLTPNQAIVIQALHEAYENGAPDVQEMVLLDRIGTTNDRLRDTFRSSLEIWKVLITSRKKGTHRLNISQNTQKI